MWMSRNRPGARADSSHSAARICNPIAAGGDKTEGGGADLESAAGYGFGCASAAVFFTAADLDGDIWQWRCRGAGDVSGCGSCGCSVDFRCRPLAAIAGGGVVGGAADGGGAAGD